MVILRKRHFRTIFAPSLAGWPLGNDTAAGSAFLSRSPHPRARTLQDHRSRMSQGLQAKEDAGERCSGPPVNRKPVRGGVSIIREGMSVFLRTGGRFENRGAIASLHDRGRRPDPGARTSAGGYPSAEGSRPVAARTSVVGGERHRSEKGRLLRIEGFAARSRPLKRVAGPRRASAPIPAGGRPARAPACRGRDWRTRRGTADQSDG